MSNNIFNKQELIEIPDANTLNKTLYNCNYNRILNIIMARITEANQRNEKSIRMNNNDINMFDNNLIIDIKTTFRNKNYTINDIETEAGVVFGWKLSWQSN
jgi:hypothetical protein